MKNVLGLTTKGSICSIRIGSIILLYKSGSKEKTTNPLPWSDTGIIAEHEVNEINKSRATK